MWQEVGTQWRVGMAGYTGLDYAGVLAHLKTAHGLRGTKLQKAWKAMRACEQGALQAWAEDAKTKRDAEQFNQQQEAQQQNRPGL